MLILNRKKDEEIYIETPFGRITLTIADLDNKSCRLGIDAPKSFMIYRKEIYDKVFEENKEALSGFEWKSDIKKVFKNIESDL